MERSLLALQSRLPGLFPVREYVEAGGLLAYGPGHIEANRSSAAHVDKILRGAKPADLPVEQSTTFDFAVNLKTAQALGLTIPPSVLHQATEIIE
jgi:putative ABC transport system substrate-binding protein